MIEGASAPFFLVALRRDEELARAMAVLGWRPILARGGAAAAATFLASGATIAVVDARGAVDEAVEVLAALDRAVCDVGGALLVVAPHGAVERLSEFRALGATHCLVEPFTAAELEAALQFAEEMTIRLAVRDGGRSLHAPAQAGWRGADGALDAPDRLRRPHLLELFRRPDRGARRRTRGEGMEPLANLMTESVAEAQTGPWPGLKRRAMLGSDLMPGFAVDRGGPDPLTGLSDARAARWWLDARLLDTHGGGDDASLFLLSLSRFDAINAAFSRDTGDEVLRQVGERLKKVAATLDPAHVVARTNGTEFAVLVAGALDEAAARALGERLCEVVGKPFAIDAASIALGCRAVGLVGGGPSADALFDQAAAALTDAGGFRLVRATDDGDRALAGQLEIDLRRALDRDEIRILFQPQVSVASGEMIGVEALARWHHPIEGRLGADTLFDAAERSDYLVQLSRHVQRKALAAAARWPAALSALRLSVNVTAQDMAQPDFAAGFLAMVDAAGFPRERLTVEITESGLIQNLAGAAELLTALRAAGLSIAIDDFGTGYSSLAYLKSLPVDYLKIDRRLSRDIAGSPRDQVVVRGIILLAHSLGLGVIAEGIESVRELALLAEEGCHVYQGFLASPAVESEALQAFVGTA